MHCVSFQIQMQRLPSPGSSHSSLPPHWLIFNKQANKKLLIACISYADLNACRFQYSVIMPLPPHWLTNKQKTNKNLRIACISNADLNACRLQSPVIMHFLQCPAPPIDSSPIVLSLPIALIHERAFRAENATNKQVHSSLFNKHWIESTLKQTKKKKK